MNTKIKSLEELQKITVELKTAGKKVVHCHGVFDLLHIGHIKHFEEAKSFGDTPNGNCPNVLISIFFGFL